MKYKLTIVIILLTITGCVSTSEYNNLEDKNMMLIEEMETLNREIESLKNIESSLNANHDDEITENLYETELEINEFKEIIKEMTISDDETKLLEFYNGDMIPMYHGITDARVKIKVELLEPLRALPSDEAPFYLNGRLSYSSLNNRDEEFDNGEFEGELLYTSIDINRVEWSLVIIDGSIGYVHSSNILEYINVDYTYETTEQFEGLKLGMSVDELDKLYSGEIDYIIPKQNYFRIASIYRDDNYNFDVFYNPNTRIIDFIRINTSDIPLKSGYKVGDNVDLVFEYYDAMYEQIDIELKFSNQHRIYDIGNGYWLEIDGIDGIVTTIVLTPGYNIYT